MNTATAPRPRRPTKYLYPYVVQGNYGAGWEDVTAEDSWQECRARLREYRENEPHYAHRSVRRRVPNPAYIPTAPKE